MTDHSTDDDSDEPRRSILPGELVADAFAELGGPDADSDDTIVTSLPSVADALRAASAEADRDSMLNIARSVASSDDDTSEAPARPRLPSSPQLRNPSNVRSPKAALPAAPPPPPSMRVSSVPAPDASTTRSSTPAPSRASLPPPSRVSLPAPSRVSLPPPSRVSLPPPSRASLSAPSRHSSPPASSPFIYAPTPPAASAPSTDAVSPLASASEPWFAGASADLTSEVPQTPGSLLPPEPAPIERTEGSRTAWHFRAAVAGLMLAGGFGGYLLNRSDEAEHADVSANNVSASNVAPTVSEQPAAAHPTPAETNDDPQVEAIDLTDLPRADAERRTSRSAYRPRKRSSGARDLPVSAAANESSASTAAEPKNDESSEDALMKAIGAKPSTGTDTPPAKEAATLATLGINSIPASTVTLNGKSLGHTPRLGVKVPPGRHVVIFEHPQHGQRRLNVKVGEGEQKTVSVRF